MFGAGLPPYGAAVKREYDFPVSASGFLIECASRRRKFFSKGLRSCSAECERRLKDRADIAATLAEVGMDEPVSRARKCDVCGGCIPMWENKRKLPSTRRFCSARCKARAAKRRVREEAA